MTDMKYTMDRVFKIWSDTSGECISVGPDRDGLDLVEISSAINGGVEQTVILNHEQAKLVIEALQSTLNRVKENEATHQHKFISDGCSSGMGTCECGAEGMVN